VRKRKVSRRKVSRRKVYRKWDLDDQLVEDGEQISKVESAVGVCFIWVWVVCCFLSCFVSICSGMSVPRLIWFRFVCALVLGLSWEEAVCVFGVWLVVGGSCMCYVLGLSWEGAVYVLIFGLSWEEASGEEAGNRRLVACFVTNRLFPVLSVFPVSSVS
jgi:hypothetical protein